MNTSRLHDKHAVPLVTDSVRYETQRKSRLNLRFSERKILLSVTDLLLVLASFLFPHILGNGAIANSLLIGYLATILVLWLSVGFSMGLYDLHIASSVSRATRLVAISMAIVYITMLGLHYVGFGNAYPQITLLYGAGVSVILLVGWRLIYATSIAKWGLRQSILIVGAGESGTVLAETLQGMQTTINSRHNNHISFGSVLGYEIVGFVDDDPEKLNSTVAGIPVLGYTSDLVTIASRVAPDQIVLSINNSDSISDSLVNALVNCRSLGYELTTMLTLYEDVIKRIPLNHAGTNITSILSSPTSGIVRVYQFLRRIFDILAGFHGCLVLVLMLPFIWLINRIYAPGPTFYTQERIGHSGKVFNIVKFRSMIVDAEKFSGAVWAEEDDPRITPVGRFLRKTRLDELPQCWNVLLGHMSIIGPRPERPHFVDLLAEQIPYYRTRHSVRPGLTGWAQVQYPYTATIEDTAIKLQYDIYYIKHQNLFLDIKILLKTIGVVIGLQGR